MKKVRIAFTLLLVIISVFAIAIPALALGDLTFGTINANKVKIFSTSTETDIWIAYMDKGTVVTVKSSTPKNDRYNISGDGYKSTGKPYHVNNGWVATSCLDYSVSVR